MSKIAELRTTLSGFLSQIAHNFNYAAITAAFQNTLSRDGSGPNEMQANIGMGNNRIINMADGVLGTDAVTVRQLVDAFPYVGTPLAAQPFATKAALVSFLPALEDGFYSVLADEEAEGGPTLYQVEDHVASLQVDYSGHTLDLLAADDGSARIGFSQPGEATIPLQERLRREMRVLDWISPEAERAAVLAGTSTVDHTNDVAAAIAAAGSEYELVFEGVIHTRQLSSSESVHWRFVAGAKLVWLAHTATPSATHITLSGDNCVIYDLHLDGNQFNIPTISDGANGLSVTGRSVTLVNPTIKKYNGTGLLLSGDNYGVQKSTIINGCFDYNAGLGVHLLAASYVDFIGGSASFNGFGWKGSRDNPADLDHLYIAFGVAVRYRSHHISFTNFSTNENGRDGLNINQGSYSIKHVACVAYANDDGGFTVASDDTGTGLPGELEACYDIEYVDCEAYNNLSSGLAVYQTAHNISVSGGRYYNNHRAAGTQSAASSYGNGVFIAGLSTGVSVFTKAYDDRQTRAITASAAGVLTAPGWVAGTALFYPKVAIYSGTTRAFKGYGQIVSETSGQVTIAATPFNPVTLGSIVVGDYVSQCVQHVGLWMDSGARGVAHVDGFGFKNGPLSGGSRYYTSFNEGGQNVQLPYESTGTELVSNPSFDAGIASWTFDLPGGGTATPWATTPRRSVGALRLVGGSSEAAGEATLVTGAEHAAAGSFVTASAWAYSDARDGAILLLLWDRGDGGFRGTTVQHPGGGWRHLQITAFIPIASLILRVLAPAGATSYWDNVSLKPVNASINDSDFTTPSRQLPY